MVAGNETTRNAISHGLWALTQFPEEKRRWLQDLEGRAITAAEEIVRWASPVLHMRRTLTRDVVFGGVEMKKGQKIAMWYISANRDEAHFKDPYRFDITREPNHQGGFGTGGAHFCLGAHLARREVVVMMTDLLRQLPDIEATGKPEKLRIEHLPKIDVPCLFISGARDAFGAPDELDAHITAVTGPVTHVSIDGAGHDLKGKNDEIVAATLDWLKTVR